MPERPVTLITGASSGIGTALAWTAAAAGHDLILTARRGSLLTELATALNARHGGRILTIEADLSQADGADQLVNEILASGWRVDQLINNAGLGASGPVAGIPTARLTDLLQVNISSLTTLTRLLLPPAVFALRVVATHYNAPPTAQVLSYRFAARRFSRPFQTTTWGDSRRGPRRGNHGILFELDVRIGNTHRICCNGRPNSPTWPGLRSPKYIKKSTENTATAG
jgi:NAD(P)-dependent dehydrogenase (short-subunit alcohol dehydrogenase family)